MRLKKNDFKILISLFPLYAITTLLLSSLPIFGLAVVLMLLDKSNNFQALGNLGTFIGAMVGVVGAIYIIRTFNELMRERISNNMTREFENNCRSIEIGMSYISNHEGNLKGGAAIIKGADLCVNGSLEFKKAVHQVGILPLKAVAASLLELIKWISKDERHFEFYVYFRVRFITIVMALESMLPSEISQMKKDQIFLKYGNDNELYALIVSILDLRTLEFDLWTKLQMHDEAQKS